MCVLINQGEGCWIWILFEWKVVHFTITYAQFYVIECLNKDIQFQKYNFREPLEGECNSGSSRLTLTSIALTIITVVNFIL